MSGRKELTSRSWRRQARHFDHKPPFTPAPWVIRKKGFALQYILKDVAISRSIAALGIVPGCKILDVGCGQGIMLDRIGASYDAEAHGVDVSFTSLNKGKADSPRGFLGVQADGTTLPFADSSFDLVTSIDLLEHIEEPWNAIDEMVRVVKPGGKIFCYAVSNRNRFSFIWLFRLALESLGIDPWSPACHTPELLIDPTEVFSRLEKDGCQVDRSESFHAFFTIIFDLALLGFYLTLSKVARAVCSRIPERWCPSWLLEVATVVCSLLFPALQWLDSPWTRRDVSNGFLITATKASRAHGVASLATEVT